MDDEVDDGQDARREEFLRKVEEDPDLPISKDLARKAFDYMIQKIDELGLHSLKLGPKEMTQQLHAGSCMDKSAEDLQEGGGDDKGGLEATGVKTHPDLEKDSKKEEGGTELDQQFKESMEKIHEDWDSSDASTKNKWSDQSDSPSLEQKLEKCPKEDHYRVAFMHEINQEKKDRRDTKKVDKRKAEAVEEAGLSWLPITKQGFNDFMLHCQGQKPVIQAHPEPLDLPAPAKTSQTCEMGPSDQEGAYKLYGKNGAGQHGAQCLRDGIGGPGKLCLGRRPEQP